MTPITPQSKPEFFYTTTVLGHEYYVPNYVVFQHSREANKLVREQYRTLYPDNCKPDIDEKKYNDWITTEEGDEVWCDCLAKVIFIPKNGAPQVDRAFIPIPVWNEARNFLDRKLPVSTFAHTDVPATETATTAAA